MQKRLPGVMPRIDLIGKLGDNRGPCRIPGLSQAAPIIIPPLAPLTAPIRGWPSGLFAHHTCNHHRCRLPGALFERILLNMSNAITMNSAGTGRGRRGLPLQLTSEEKGYGVRS